MYSTPLLQVTNLHVEASSKSILQGINLTVHPGKVYALVGPNGAGKSTLARVLAGMPGYKVSKGGITFLGNDLLDLAPEDRARQGLFMSFQQPIAIPGLSILNFLKAALHQVRQQRGLPELNTLQVVELVRERMQHLGMDPSLMHKPLNENLSGGERKLNELLQMAVLGPKLAILDEIDSGLDTDARSLLGNALKKMKRSDCAIIIITHYPYLFKHITPDIVCVLQKGRIVRSAGYQLGYRLLEEGYEGLDPEG